jgi:hypothetical protein
VSKSQHRSEVYYDLDNKKWVHIHKPLPSDNVSELAGRKQMDLSKSKMAGFIKEAKRLIPGTAIRDLPSLKVRLRFLKKYLKTFFPKNIKDIKEAYNL